MLEFFLENYFVLGLSFWFFFLNISYSFRGKLVKKVIILNRNYLKDFVNYFGFKNM